MDINNLNTLMEAYQQIYAPQELTEEVEIAAEYFYNLGLNDEGVDIFIEELGVEEFGLFVSELSEEYYLDEATETRLQKKGALKGPKGSKPQSTTKATIKKQGGTKMSASAAPSSTVNPKKVAAAAKKAKENQPKKRPVLDAIARQVTKGMERHKAAMSAARETGKTIGKAAKGAGHVASEFGKGVGAVAKIGKKVLTGEEIDLFDYMLEYLVAEGYAETNETALAIMANMSEEWKENILEETRRTEYLRSEEYVDEAITSEKGKAKAAEMIAARSTPSGRAKAGQGANVAQIKHIQRSNRDGLGGTPPNRKVAGSNWPKSYSGIGGTGNKAARRAAALKNEELDTYDIVLEYLCVEGYADTLEEAEWIMANELDFDAIDEIIEAFKKANLDKMKAKEAKHASDAFKKGTDDDGKYRSDSKNRSMKMHGVRSAIERGEDPRADTYGGAQKKPVDHRAGFSKNPLNNPPRPVKKPGV